MDPRGIDTYSAVFGSLTQA